MDAADFVLSALSHFVKGSEGPPPGVPARAGARFETRFAAIAVDHGVTPIVSRSLDMLALPPAISRVTATRLETHGEATRVDASRRIRLTARVLEALQEADLPALVMGDVLSAASLYGGDRVRGVGRVELIVNEGRTREALVAASSVGFKAPTPHPVFGQNAEVKPASAPSATDVAQARAWAKGTAREVVEYHHYMVPLVLWNDAGESLELRHRVLRLGHPDPGGERVWERSRSVVIAGHEARAVSIEDHLVDLVVRIGIAGYTDLAAITDVGLILRRHARDINWGHVAFRVRMHGLYSAFHHVLAHVCRALGLASVDEYLEPPAPLYAKWFDLFWQPASIDYLRGGRDNRFLYGLAACGGAFSKLSWAWRSWVPRPNWVSHLVGPASSPLNWLEFLMAVRGMSRRQPPTGGPRHGETASIARFERKKH